MIKKHIVKLLVLLLLILIALGIYYYYEPYSVEMDFSLSGSIRSAEGDILAPCTVSLDGEQLYYLFKNKPNLLRGTLQLTDEEVSVRSVVVLNWESIPTPNGSPLGKLEHAYGYRYRGQALGAFTCNLYYTEDLSFCVIVDNKTIYCVSSLSEAETTDLFRQFTQLATPVA